MVVINSAGVYYFDSTVSLMKSSVSKFSPGSWPMRDWMLKVGTSLRKSVVFASHPLRVSKKSSLVIEENGSDSVVHRGHSHSGGRGRFLLLRLEHPRWEYLEHVLQKAKE